MNDDEVKVADLEVEITNPEEGEPISPTPTPEEETKDDTRVLTA